MTAKQVIDCGPDRDTLQDVIYFPNYGGPGPYQKLIYTDMERLKPVPGTVELALERQQLISGTEAAPVVLHLHWVGAVLAGAKTRDDAADLHMIFQQNLTRFVGLGGIVLWTVHPAELSRSNQFGDVERQLCQDVANLALRIHIHTRKYLSVLEAELVIDSRKLLVQPLEPGKSGAVLEREIRKGYQFSHVPIAFERATKSCLLTGRSFPPKRVARTAIVILNYQSREDTQRLIRALQQSTDQKFDLYVVDNCSPDLSVFEAAVIFPGSYVLRLPENLGYAAGNNAALWLIEPLGYQFVWILNPDIVVPPKALRQHVAAAADYPEVSIFGPAICRGANPDLVASAGSYVSFEDGFSTGHLYAAKPVDKLPETPYEAECLTGASLFLRSTVIKKIGYIPEDYFLYFEETQWLLEAGKIGLKCLVLPHIRPVHHQRSHEGGLPAVYYFYYYLRNALLFSARMGHDDLEPVSAALRGGFMAAWLLRIEEGNPDQLDFYKRLAERALSDGRKGLSGRIDLTALEQTLRQPVDPA